MFVFVGLVGMSWKGWNVSMVVVLGCWMLLGNVGADSGGNSAFQTIVASMEKQYGKERAAEVFQSVVETMEKGKGEPNMEEISKLVEAKIDEMKLHVSDQNVRAGMSKEVETLRLDVTELASELSSLLKVDQSSAKATKMAAAVNDAVVTIRKMAVDMQTDVHRVRINAKQNKTEEQGRTEGRTHDCTSESFQNNHESSTDGTHFRI